MFRARWNIWDLKVRKVVLIALVLPLLHVLPTAQAAVVTQSQPSLRAETPSTKSASLTTAGLLYRFDARNLNSYPGTGSTWNSLSSGGGTATLFGSLTTATQNAGGTNMSVMSFAANSKYADINGNLDDFSAGFSASFYANFGNANNWERIIDFGERDAANNILIAREGTTNNFQFQIYQGASAKSCWITNGITNNTWNHWAVTYNNSTCTIYKDGVLQTISTSGAATMQNVTRANGYIGRSNWGADSYFEGSIADLAIYQGILNQSQVNTNRTSQTSAPITVSISANGGSGSASSSTIYSNYDGTFTLPTKGTISYGSYEFSGWNTATNGQGTNYLEGQSFSTGASVTLYARWQSVITFSANSGSGTPTSSSTTVIGVGSSATLTTRGTLTRNLYSFSGWNTSANGTGTNYAESSSIVPTGSITLYAQWNSTLSYDGNTSTSTRSIESTTATSSATNTTLGSGRLVRGSPIASGLVLNLDAADSSTVSSTTWTNKANASQSATIVGSPTYSASEGAFTLNGSSQYFDLGTTAFNFSGTQNYTINVAFKNNEPMKDTGLFTRHNAGVAGNYYVTNNSGKYYITREVSPWATYSNSYVDPSQVNYVSAVFNGTSLTVFVNGVSDGSIAMSGSVGNNTIKTLIGARLSSGSPISYLNGKIYSVQVYNRALAASEILTNYQELVPEARVSKNNFTLAGWTTAPSSGTVVAGNVTDLAALPTPYLRLLPENYNATSKVWTATNGSGAAFTYTGTPAYSATGGGNYGASKTFPVISGATSAGIRLNNSTLTSYALCVVARFKGDSIGGAGSQGRLINSSNSNWISGFYNGQIRQFHHEAWNFSGSTTDLNWHYYCDSGNKAMWDGVNLSPWTYQSTTSLPPIAINWDPYGQNSDWELAELIIYDQFLSDAALSSVSRYFKNQYGIVGGSSTSSAAGGLAAVSNYASSGDATLYANWGSTITYDGNGQTSGIPPVAHIITGSSGSLAANTGSLAKAGFRFDGWNTAANGSGTFYAPGATYPNSGNVILYAQYSQKLVFPTQYAAVDPIRLSPYMRFKAEDYNPTQKVWIDSSGNGRNTSTVAGAPSLITASLGNGNTKTFKAVSGSIAERIKFNNPLFSNSNYTLITVARYSGATKGRIFDADGYNWLHGFWQGSSGVAYHEGWVTATSSVVHGSNWLIGASFANNYRSNGTSRGSSGGVNYMPPMTINYGSYSGERSDFQVAEVLIFDYKLTTQQLAQVEDYLSQTYGIDVASPGTYPTASSLAIGAGVGGRGETLTAISGLANKTFSMSPTRSGFSLDTSTANSVALVVAPTVATGTYAQTIIATEGGGETATYLLNVTVSPAVKFDTSTATTLITTHRRGATLRLNTVFGVGTKVFTMTSAGTGISLDTSTAASGFATLRVDTYTAVGTYTQLITVTDDTRIRSTYTVTITINGPPTVASTSAITTTPVTFGLRLNLDAGDQESYSGSGTTWTNLATNSNNATWQVSPTFSTASGGTFDLNGSTQWAAATSIRTSVFTVEVWAKLNALNNNYACLVTDTYNADKINYSICFRGNSTIAAAYHQNGTGWVGGQTGAFTPVVGTWYQYVYTVELVGSNYVGTLYVNNTKVGASTSNAIAPTSDLQGLRIGRRWDTGEYINGSIPIVRIYDRALSTTEIAQNYNAVLPRFTSNPTNAITITTTESVSATSSIYYAGLGTGNKTFSLSNPTAGISIDTATVNTVRLNVATTVAATSTTVARSISQVISTVDASGVAAATPVYVTTIINPKIIIADQSPGNLSTTFGKVAYDTFTATQGTGSKTFTVSSTSYASAFVISNPNSNTGLLTVANTLPAGTYPIVVTATDSVGATTTYTMNVVVNPIPTIAGATGNTVSTTVTRSASLRINVIGGTGTRTISWTSPNSGITLDISTLSAQNYLTLNVSASVPVNTYSFAISATDSSSVRVSDTFTVVINRWPSITNPELISAGLRLNLDPSNYSGSGTWSDTSGNGFNAVMASGSTTPTGTAPTFNSESGGYFRFGTTGQSIQAGSVGVMETFSVSAWVRMSSLTNTNNPAIIAEYSPTGNVNYLIQMYAGKIVGSYRVGSTWSLATEPGFVPDLNTWMYVTYVVSKNGPGSYTNSIYKDGILQGPTQASTAQPVANNGVVIMGRRWDTTASTFNGDIGAVNIYNRSLSAAEVLQNYNAQASRFLSSNSGNTSASVTQGVAGSITGVAATQGTGTKTFALSNAATGISLTNTAANTFTLTLPDTLTATSTTVARVMTETVTATDQAGATTSRVYSITVNPPVKIESTTATVTTTSGIVAWDTFTATLGTGAKTFTMSSASALTGFTLTQANSQALLKVGSTVNPGTYVIAIRATDSVGAIKDETVTVVVNQVPIIIGSSSVVGTAGYAFSSPVYSASNGTGTLTFTLTAATGITLSSSTGSPTINVASNVVSDTYTVTLRVTDSMTATTTMAISIRVNVPVTLNGNKTLSKVYGEDLAQVYQTSSGTAPFNIFTSNICTSEKSTYVGNGTNGTLNKVYTVEKFNGVGSCSWVVPSAVSEVSVLTVAGGGGGGGSAWAGGGGAGGVVYVPALSVTPKASIPIVVGGGGAGGTSNTACSAGSSPSQGSNGSNSSFNSTFTAIGGGGGGGYGWTGYSGCGTGKAGGSGGGSGETDYNPVRAVSTQGSFAGATSYGNSGGITVFLGGIQAGSGGGGAGGIGASTASSRNHVAGAGGIGISNSITGTATMYGGGGGGATCISGCTAGASVGAGGAGGGGNGGHGGANPTNGTDGLGGGGGGSQTGTGANGGSGSVIVRYETPVADSSTTLLTMSTLTTTPTGSVQLNAPKNLPVGTYTQTITVKDSTGSTGSTPVTVTLSVSKATPSLALSLPGGVNTANYGSPVIISATSPVPGTVLFKNGATNISNCSAVTSASGLAICTWTPTSIGATTLKATLTPTDTSNYNSSAEISLAITVNKADTLTVTVTSESFTYSGSAVAVTQRFTTTGLAAIDSLTAISMLYSGTANTGTYRSSTTAPTDAGIYTITPNYPTNAAAYTFAAGTLGTTSAITNYESVTVVAGTLTVNRQPQTFTFTYPDTNTATYSPNRKLTATATTALGAGAKTYTTSTPTICSIETTSVVTVLGAGSCIVNMAVALTANYEADTATRTITINKAPRTFTLVPASATVRFSDTTTVTANISGGAADGTITYTLGSPAGCTFDPLTGELTAISGTIQCPLSATISEGLNYLAETSTAISLTIAPALAPTIVIDTVTALSHTPGIRALVMPNYTVSGLKGTDSAGSLTFTYSFVSNPFESFTYSDTRTPIDAGTYRITPSALTLSSGLISNYETSTYSSSAINFVINRIAQETVTIVTTNGEVDVPFTLQASGGSTNGAVTYAKLAGASCSVAGNSLTATASGSCVLSVTRAGNRNYLPFISESITVMVRNYVIFQVTTPTNPNTGITIAPSTPVTKGENACTTGCVPRLTSADVYDVAEGDLILLTGTSLLTVTKVYFNIYTEAPNFTANSDTELAVRVPANLPQGDATIEVISPGGTSNRLFDFIILP